MATELERVQATLSALERAGALWSEPRRVQAFALDCLELVRAHLPPELWVTLSALQESTRERASTPAPSALDEGRLGCWSHLQACACQGSGAEVHAVRALLTLLETPEVDELSRLCELVRLVCACRPPSGSVEALVERSLATPSSSDRRAMHGSPL